MEVTNNSSNDVQIQMQDVQVSESLSQTETNYALQSIAGGTITCTLALSSEIRSASKFVGRLVEPAFKNASPVVRAGAVAVFAVPTLFALGTAGACLSLPQTQK